MAAVCSIVIVTFAALSGVQATQPATHPGNAGRLPSESKASLDDQKPRAHVFADPDWFHWGGTPVLGDDGRYHLYYDRFPRSNGRLMRGWLYESEVAHAVSARPEGPYEFKGVVLRGAGEQPEGRWDACNAHNAYCVRLLDPETKRRRYYLYYVANRDDDSTFNDWYDHIVTQRIGVAVSDSPDGPWTRHPEPVCVPAAPLRGYVVNPGVTQLPDGRVMMLLKGRAKNQDKGATRDTMGAYLQGWALADHPTGPFVIQPTLLFPGSIAAEDPCVFVWNHRIYAAVKDWHGQLSGSRGISWVSGTLDAEGKVNWSIPTPNTDALISARKLVWSDGTSTGLDSLERPFILQDASGRPTHLFAAAAVADPFLHSGIAPRVPPPSIPGSHLPFNVCIPLVPND